MNFPGEYPTDGELPDFSLYDATDQLILTHRDAHFGGSFPIMEEYYTQEDNKGIQPDIDLARIQHLADVEKTMSENLAALLLSGADAERISRSRLMYRQLRDIFDIDEPKNPIPSLIAGLILAEQEEEEEAIEAVVARGKEIVPALLELMNNPDLHDPLFPGYGQAPLLAARCLGEIKDSRAIMALYEMIGDSDMFDEEFVLNALKQIGDPARDFLLKVLHGKPFNQDNEKAAIALLSFKSDPIVSKACLETLENPEAWKHPLLCSYLLFVCEGLQSQDLREQLLQLGRQKGFPSVLQPDLDVVERSWKNQQTSGG